LQKVPLFIAGVGKSTFCIAIAWRGVLGRRAGYWKWRGKMFSFVLGWCSHLCLQLVDFFTKNFVEQWVIEHVYNVSYMAEDVFQILYNIYIVYIVCAGFSAVGFLIFVHSYGF